MSPVPPGLPEPPPETKCPFHGISIKTCGGPHTVTETTVGSEVLGPGEVPVGKRISQLSEAERKEHMEAEAEAQRDSDS